MFQEVSDFRDESEALYSLLSDLGDEQFETKSQFKSWTINDVLGHLHFWNTMALLSLTDENKLLEKLGEAFEAIPTTGLRPFEDREIGDLKGTVLREEWRRFCLDMTDEFANADPKARVKWAGPDMSVRSSITARLMETWAHGQAVYDALGVERQNTDRIKGIAVLGINTFAWTFRNRGLDVPEKRPFVRLVAPSGATWEFGEPDSTDRVEGAAHEFCQVVTQTRNVADTELRVVGKVARTWMQTAQCFAGPAENPPAPGTRYRAE